MMLMVQLSGGVTQQKGVGASGGGRGQAKRGPLPGAGERRSMSYKPILFNTEMVKAIKDGWKTQTRRIAKQLCGLDPREDGLPPEKFEFFISPRSGALHWEDLLRSVTVDGNRVFAPVMPGDILWVREKWQHVYNFDDGDQLIEGTGRYVYYADNPMTFDYWVDPDTGEHKEQMPWKPSIHMPKEAARIFLRVKDVRVERLQDITETQALMEGCYMYRTKCEIQPGHSGTAIEDFHRVWDSTIKRSELEKYGWNENPWVWVIEFERCEKPADFR